MSKLTLDTLKQRIDRLEREAWRWRGIGATALVLLGVIGLVAATKVPDEIRAKSFVVKDEQGRIRARLGMGKSMLDKDIYLELYDPDGGTRVRLTTKSYDNHSPILTMVSGHPGWVQLNMELDEEGMPSLRLFNPKGGGVIWKAP